MTVEMNFCRRRGGKTNFLAKSSQARPANGKLDTKRAEAGEAAKVDKMASTYLPLTAPSLTLSRLSLSLHIASATSWRALFERERERATSKREGSARFRVSRLDCSLSMALISSDSSPPRALDFG